MEASGSALATIFAPDLTKKASQSSLKFTLFDIKVDKISIEFREIWKQWKEDNI